MVNLSLTEKGGSTNDLSFDKDEVTIGRVRGNDIVLPKGNVSKHHCRLLLRGNEMVVEDLRSTNGTYVNGRKISTPTTVSLSDKVFVGDFIIRLTAVAAAETARPSAPAGPPEAGSLSSAVPRRPPPPPPPPTRPSSIEEMPGGPGKSAGPVHTPPPPPPPAPPKRESMDPPAAAAVPYTPPLGSTNIDLDDDDDALGTPRPHITVPPLKPAVQMAPPVADSKATQEGEESEDPSRTPVPIGEESGPSLAADDGAPPLPPDSADEDVVEPPTGVGRRRAETTPPPATLQKPQPPAKTKGAPSSGSRPMAKPLDRDVPEWLARLLERDGVSAAFLIGPNQAEVERNGQRESASVSASDMAGLAPAIRKLTSKGSPKPDPDATTVNVILPDGMHIAAIFPPATDRLCVALRRPIAAGKTLDDLVEDNSMSPAMRQVLDACVTTRQNILVSGDRAACEAVLPAILWSVDRMARVVLLSDTMTPPASAASWIRVQRDAKATDLVAAAVAMQPEYIIVDAGHSALGGEILAECDLGQKGAMISLVARSSSEALARLRALGCKQGLPAAQAADMVDGCVDLVVQAAVLADGSLRVVELAEPKESKDGQVTAHALLSWIPGHGGAVSFTATGVRSRLGAKLATAGIAMPAEILNQH